MKLQVLVAAVSKEINELAENMHLKTDAVIVNQCDSYGYQEFFKGENRIQSFSMAERGVGLNRNTALLHATGDIVLFSDEDICFYDDYKEKVISAFEKNRDADLITFNFKVHESRATYYNTKERRIRWHNYGRYPTFAVAAKLDALRKANVSFSLLFGGGAKYSNGEDSLFLRDCLKCGMHMYASTEEIGEEVFRESTWFCGYNEKFFADRGVLYHFLYGKLAKPFSLRFLFAHKGEMCKEVSLKQAYRWMKSGIAEGKLR